MAKFGTFDRRDFLEYSKSRYLGPQPWTPTGLQYDVVQQKWALAKSMVKTLMAIEEPQGMPFP